MATLQARGSPVDLTNFPTEGDYHYEGTKGAMTWLAAELRRIRNVLKADFGPIHMTFGVQCIGDGNQAFLRKWADRIEEVLGEWADPKIIQAKDEVIQILNNASLSCEQKQVVQRKAEEHFRR